MVVEEETPKQRSGHKRKGQPSDKKSKVVLKEFRNAKAIPLAKLGRRIYRFHACIDQGFPTDATLHFCHVLKYISTLPDTSMAEALKRVGKNDALRKRLIGYVRLFSFNLILITDGRQMFYGVGQLRSDWAIIIRVKTRTFFGIPERKTVEQIVSVILFSFSLFSTRNNRSFLLNGCWKVTASISGNLISWYICFTTSCLISTPLLCLQLLKGIAPAKPFGSELLPQILQSILVDRRVGVDLLLFEHLTTIKRIPLPLIALICTLVLYFLHRKLSY